VPAAPTKRLIVNADDFGLTTGVNLGIVRGFREGVLTSATLMPNAEAFDHAVEVARAARMPLGIHLVAVGGPAVAPARAIPSLVDQRGMLPSTLGRLLGTMARGGARVDDLEREFHAQVARVVGAGITPTHLDTHKHTHAHPRVMRALARAARSFGIRCVRNPFEGLRAALDPIVAGGLVHPDSLRQCAMSAAAMAGAWMFRRLAVQHALRTPDHFRGVALTGALDGPALCRVIRTLSPGTTELMCHPGVCDEALAREGSRLTRQRERELAAVVDPAVRRCLDETGVRLVGYRDLLGAP
jgi:hopanoid biosynthesis associated protein HpnK